MGTGLLALASILQITVIAIRWLQANGLPIFTRFDFLNWLTVSLVLISLIMSFFQKSEYAILLLGVISFCIIVLNRFWMPVSDHVAGNWDGVRGLLVLHITLASLSFAALTVASVFACMYLYLHRKLKVKKWDDTVRRLPSLEMIDKYTYSAMLIGVPLLIASLILAMLSLYEEKRWELLLDLKVSSTLMALAIYGWYFVRKRSSQHSGAMMARWTLLGYAFTILNFVLNSWSEFHRWTGA